MNGSLRILKWVGIVMGGLIGIVLVAAVMFYFVGGANLNKKYVVTDTAVPVPTDPAAIARGEHLAVAVSFCVRCHGANLGGAADFVIPGMLTIPTPNLTSGAGGVGDAYTDEDWVRAIRHGVGRDGRTLMIMPSRAYHELSADDLGALIAYVKSVPPVDSNLPQRRIEPLARIMAGVGMFPPAAADHIDHAAPLPEEPMPGATAAYGEYLSHTCRECHGDNLNGAPFGPPGQEVETPNLTPGGDLAGWSEEDFFDTIRSGVTPDGKTLDAEMPWPFFGRMSDEELRAVWLYLQSLPALPQEG